MPICIKAQQCDRFVGTAWRFGFAQPWPGHDSSREGWPYLEMSAYLLMTIRNWEIPAGTDQTRTYSRTNPRRGYLLRSAPPPPAYKWPPRFINEPYSRGPQTETRTLTTAPNLNINMRIDLMMGASASAYLAKIKYKIK